MGTLVCTLEMSKESGVTITVTNADDSITQTVTMDGTTLQLKVAGSEETSTYTQTSDAIKIECKDFTLTAKNSITCTANEGKILHQAKQDTFTIKSDAKDMTLESGAKITGKATADMALSGANIKAEAQTGVTVKGGAKVEVSGPQLSLKGTAKAEMAAPQVTVKADAQLSAESSGMATLGGSLTTIKGSLINAG